MKPYFFLSAFFFLFERGLEAQSYSAIPLSPSQSPSVAVPPQIARLVWGTSNYLNPNTNTKTLDCPGLLNRTWTYSNAQMVLICGEAETACIRYGMIQQTLARQQQENSGGEEESQGFSTENLTSTLAECLSEVKFKLMGCAVALQSVGDYNSLLHQSGCGPSAGQPSQPSESSKKK